MKPEEKLARGFADIIELVNAQAEDEGLWAYPIGRPATIAEAYALQELRNLHALIEKVAEGIVVEVINDD